VIEPAAHAGVALSGLFHRLRKLQHVCLPALVGCASAVYRARAAIEQAAHPVGQLAVMGLCGDGTGTVRLDPGRGNRPTRG
jgi:hypothetical protein